MDNKKRIILIVTIVLFVISISNLIEVADITGRATQDSSGTSTICLNHPPEITVISSQNATIGTIFNLQVQANDTDNHTLNYYDNSSLFDINQSGYISFTPQAANSGNHSILITIEDNSNCTNANVTSMFNFSISGEEAAGEAVEEVAAGAGSGGGGGPALVTPTVPEEEIVEEELEEALVEEEVTEKEKKEELKDIVRDVAVALVGRAFWENLDESLTDYGIYWIGFVIIVTVLSLIGFIILKLRKKKKPVLMGKPAEKSAEKSTKEPSKEGVIKKVFQLRKMIGDRIGKKKEREGMLPLLAKKLHIKGKLKEERKLVEEELKSLNKDGELKDKSKKGGEKQNPIVKENL